MTERNPHSNSAEHEADYSTYAGIAGDFFDRYVGDAAPTSVEDVAAWREQTRNEVADHMASIARDMPEEERVKAYTDIIDGLKELRNYTGAKPMEEGAVSTASNSPEANSTPDKENQAVEGDASSAGVNEKKLSLWDKANVIPSIWATRLAGYIGEKSQAAEMRRTESLQQRSGETDEAYEKRLRKHKTRTRIGAAALTTTVVATVIAARFAGVADEAQELIGGGNSGGDAGGVIENGFGESDYREGGIDQEVGIDIPQTYEQSIQTERSFLAENGRINNDFNSIDQFAGKESIMSELHEQYTKSPSELSGQLFQIQQIEGVVTEIPDHLRLLDGESYEQYTARLSEVLHRDAGLHDLLADYTTDYVQDKFNLQEMPAHYRAAYIDENGVTHWDTDVSSSDPDDKIIMLGNGKGIRLPCGQPVEIIPVEALVPQGVGGAPLPVTEYTPTPNNPPMTPGTPGIGGPPPVVEVPPVDTPPVDTPPIDTPPVDTPPIEQPPEELKDFNLIPELEGLVPLPLDESITPGTEAPTVGDNGTGAPDFMPGVEESTPGSDTGPTVSAPEAQAPTIDVSGNSPEAGANQVDSTGNSTPNGTFEDNL